VELIISGHHAGLRAALVSRFAKVPWQRCQFHLQRNAMAFVPRVEMRAEVAADLRALFDSPDRTEAERRLQLVGEKYKGRVPRLSQWLEANVEEGLTMFAFPRSHWRRLRTSNLVERLTRESNAARGWQGCSRTRPPCFAWSRSC
jgi:transposase-like protein